MGELVVAARYWCHMCAAAVSPVAAEAGVEIKCPYCSSGFLEEMETARSSVANGRAHAHAHGGTYPSADNAISIWAPIIDSMVGDPVRRRRSSNRRTVDAVATAEDELDNVDFSRRRRRATAFLRLLQAIRERQLQRIESASSLGGGGGGGVNGGLEAEHFSPFGRSIFAAAPLGEHGMALGDYFLGPGLDALMQQLSESDAGRQGTPPAKKDAVEALPTVEICGGANDEDTASCAVCLEDYACGEHARELPCRHRFHSLCIVPWLEMHSSCPICRFQLPADDEPKSSCGSGSGSNSGTTTTTTTYVTYVSADVNDNGDESGDGGGEAAGNAAVEHDDGGEEEAEGNVTRLPPSISWLNTLFSQQSPSPSSTSTSGSSSRYYED
uniref:Uncharacterized protein n=1 Tax=Avena sativa TaxID=4498 RepID=A0ACD5W0N8_AVESA